MILHGSRTFPGLLATIALVATVLVPTAQAQAAPQVDFESIDAYVRAEVEASGLPVDEVAGWLAPVAVP